MTGLVLIQSEVNNLQLILNIAHFVDVRISPQVTEETVKVHVNTPGRHKPKLVNEKRLVPTGRLQVSISTVAQGYSLTYANREHGEAMFKSIELALISAQKYGEGFATDKVAAPEIEANVEAPSEIEAEVEAEATPSEPSPPRVGAEAAIEEVIREGFDPDPEFVPVHYVCTNCGHEYSIESSDPGMTLACSECGTHNTPDDLLS